MQKHIKNYIKEYGFEDYKPCDFCGVTNGVMFHFHHIVFKSHFGSDEASNIVYLCELCHQRAHYLRKPYISVTELQNIKLQQNYN